MPSIAKICKVSDCDNDSHARGWCTRHYSRWYVNGTTKLKTEQDRFWSKVEKTDTCWLWKTGRFSTGYGMFSVGSRLNNKCVLAHRYAYNQLYGEYPPKGMHIDHLCRIRHCVNPAHLEVVTPRENTIRGKSVTHRKSKLPMGVYMSGKSIIVKKRLGNKLYYLGVYDTPEEASIVYQTASF